MKDQMIGLEPPELTLACKNTDFLLVDGECSYKKFDKDTKKYIDNLFLD
jgi:hypothetical protein